MLEDNRRGAGCVRSASAARGVVTPARRWTPCWLMAALCVALFALPVMAQEGGAPVTNAPQDTGDIVQRVKDQWMLFSFLGGLSVISLVASVLLSRKRPPPTTSQVGLAGAVAAPGESPWARSAIPSQNNQAPPLAPTNGAANGQPAWDAAVVPTVSPDVSSQQAAAAQYAALHTPNPAYQADPMMPATTTAQAVAEVPAPNTPIVPLGYPLSTPASRAQVDFLVANESVVPSPHTTSTSSTASGSEQTIYVSADGDRTIEEASPTLTVLPGYFEIVASGDPVKDPIGTRKKLYALNNNPDFGIARPTNDQEQIANFIPLHSKRVSRSTDKQGKVVYDFQKGVYTVINFADPTHSDPDRRCNPIRVEGRPLMPNEGVTIQDGDRIQVGDIMLRFHIEGRPTNVAMPKSPSKKSRNASRNSA